MSAQHKKSKHMAIGHVHKSYDNKQANHPRFLNYHTKLFIIVLVIITIFWMILLFDIKTEEDMELQLLHDRYSGKISLIDNVDDFNDNNGAIKNQKIHFNEKWKSQVSLDFDYIISSINNSDDFHLSLSECSICDAVQEQNVSYSHRVTNAKRLHDVKVIDYVDDLEPYLVSCSNEFDKSFDLELPVGYPVFNKNKMGPWIHNFKYFCFTHSPGIEMDNSFINEKYTFRMGFKFKLYGFPEFCLYNKYIVDLTPPTNVNIYNGLKIRNMVFIASYFAGNAFQLFLGGVMTKMSMIYSLLMDQLKMYDDEFLNVTIISHLDIRIKEHIKIRNSIQNWFWPRFVNHFKENKFKERKRINITLLDTIDHIGWLKTTKYTYYSSMFVMPHLILSNARNYSYDHYIYPRGILKPLQWIFEVNKTKNTKPYIILYYSRGDHIAHQRSIKNNLEVINAIKYWIHNALNMYQNETVYQFEIFTHIDIDKDKELVSSAILHIGPHGGQFANAIFAKPNTFLFEFNDWLMINNRDNEMRSAYYALSQSKNLHYYYLCPKDFDYQTNATHPQKSHHMEINIDQLNAVLFMIQQKILNH